MMKKLAVLLGFFILVGIAPVPTIHQVPQVQAQETYFVGSANSNKYHRPECRWARKIKSSNLVKFESKEQARAKGYVACKVCKP